MAHHRRKLRSDARVDVMKVGGNKLVYLCLLLRLAVLLNHSRSDQMLPAIELTVGNAQQWQLVFLVVMPRNGLCWLRTCMMEQVQFKHWDVELDIQSEQFVDE